jgi:hypothetical protein
MGRELTAWGGLALMRRMLQGMKLSEAAKQWDLPQPCSNRGYEPMQIIEQFLVSIWRGANRFDMAWNEQVQGQIYRWLFADDSDIQGWRYGAMVTSLELPALQVWRLYRGRADCENRIKELKADFGLDSFNMAQFWATEAALGMAMLAYNLMSLFRQAAMRSEVHHTLATLHHKVFAIGAFWDPGPENPVLRLAVARRRRKWFEGLWTQAEIDPGLHRFGHA